MESIIKKALDTTVSIMETAPEPEIRLTAARIIFENAGKVKEIMEKADFEKLFR